MDSKTIVLVVSLLVANPVFAFGGTYHSISEDGTAELTLKEVSAGQFEGTLTFDGYAVPIVGATRNGELVGEFREGDGEVYAFTARKSQDSLVLKFDDGEYVSLAQGPLPAGAAQPAFDDRQPWPPEPPSQTQTQQPGQPQQPQPDQPEGSQVSVNGQPLTPQQVQQLARYGIQVQAGHYWYDPVCGAWGAWGGPTAGFVQAGIPVAPLPHNASNGNTGVFVNGRNIAYNELLYLQALAQGQIAPGRYWLDATGNAGQVGGPALINFLQAARAASSGGGTDTWYGRGSAGWSSSDGSGGVWISNPYGGTGTTVTY